MKGTIRVMSSSCPPNSRLRSGYFVFKDGGSVAIFREGKNLLSKNPPEFNEATKILSCKWEWRRGRARGEEAGRGGFLHDWFWQSLTSISSVWYSGESKCGCFAVSLKAWSTLSLRPAQMDDNSMAECRLIRDRRAETVFAEFIWNRQLSWISPRAWISFTEHKARRSLKD